MPGTQTLSVTRQKLLTKTAGWMLAHFAEKYILPNEQKIHFTDKGFPFIPPEQIAFNSASISLTRN
jgi:hypothetical protein